MATYSSIAGNPPMAVRHWYICGPERGLAQGAYQEIRRMAIEHTGDVHYLDGANTPPDLVLELLRDPYEWGSDQPPLVIVEGATEVQMAALRGYKSSEFPAWLIAVGDHQPVGSKDESYRYFFGKQASRAVVCKSMDREALARMVMRRLNCGGGFARALVEASGGDTAWLCSEVHKMSAFDFGPELKAGHVRLVTSGSSGADLPDLLLKGSKGLALRSIPTPAASPAMFRELERLTLMGALVNEAQKNVGWSVRVLLERTGLSQGELAMLRSHINVFGRIPTERRLRVLAKVSTRAIRGDRSAWQTLIALW